MFNLHLSLFCLAASRISSLPACLLALLSASLLSVLLDLILPGSFILIFSYLPSFLPSFLPSVLPSFTSPGTPLSLRDVSLGGFCQASVRQDVDGVLNRYVEGTPELDPALLRNLKGRLAAFWTLQPSEQLACSVCQLLNRPQNLNPDFFLGAFFPGDHRFFIPLFLIFSLLLHVASFRLNRQCVMLSLTNPGTLDSTGAARAQGIGGCHSKGPFGNGWGLNADGCK